MKDAKELLTDALLDMRSEAIAKRAQREAAAALEPLTVWTVARIVPASFELGGVRALPHGTGDTTKAFPDQCSRISELVRQAREWNGKARAGYSNMHVGSRKRAGSGSGPATSLPVTSYRKVRQSKARRLLGRAA